MENPQFGWNFDDSKFTNKSALTLNSGNKLTIREDSIRAGSYKGMFDLSRALAGSNVSSYTDLIRLDGGLSPVTFSDFNFKDTKGSLYGYIHIGSYGPKGRDSIWIGVHQPSSPVPIPGAAWLLFSGLLGIGTLEKIRRFKNRS